MCESFFAEQAWKLYREHPQLTLHDLIALRSKLRPDSKLDVAAAEFLIYHIFSSMPLGSPQRLIVTQWALGQGI